MTGHYFRTAIASLTLGIALWPAAAAQAPGAAAPAAGKFHLEEATIAGIQRAILDREITANASRGRLTP
jgi:hypothetical protein